MRRLVWPDPNWFLVVLATAVMRKAVRLSGAGKSKRARPSSPVRRLVFQNARATKLLRVRWLAPMADAPPPPMRKPFSVTMPSSNDS